MLSVKNLSEEKMKHWTTMFDYGESECIEMVDRAVSLKAGAAPSAPNGKVFGMLFFNPFSKNAHFF